MLFKLVYNQFAILYNDAISVKYYLCVIKINKMLAMKSGIESVFVFQNFLKCNFQKDS